MARRSDHSREQIREMALQAAEQLIIEQGYKGLSSRKVAAQIGYTVGTLYLIFKNQDEFILNINSRTLDELYQAMEQTITLQSDPQTCVLALCRTYYDFAQRHTHRWLLIFEHTLPNHNTLPDWYTCQIKQGFDMLETILRNNTDLANKEEISKATRVLWGGVHGISMLAVTERLDVLGVDSVYELIDSLVNNYMKGLLSES